MKALFSPKGRLGRKEFFLSYVAMVGFVILLQNLLEMSISNLVAQFGSVTYVVVALVLMTCVAVFLFMTAKRLHDLGVSGWYSFVLLVPVVNLVFVIALFFLKGKPGKNEYDVSRGKA